MSKFLDQSGVTALTKNYDERYASIVDTPSAIPSSTISLIMAGVDPSSVDPVLENNSWATIRTICELGLASAVGWAVGDTKQVVGGDGYSRPVMIVDMQGLYNKHVVFQFRYRTENSYAWDPDNINDYAASDMNTVHLVAGSACFNELVSNDLAAQLTNTTVKVAENGNSSTLVDVTNKLFLPAEKEISSTRNYSRFEEFDALITFQWYITHNTAADYIIHKASNPTGTSGSVWWERSSLRGSNSSACNIDSNGLFYNADAWVAVYGVAPCFAF